jgi:hypothetical protein
MRNLWWWTEWYWSIFPLSTVVYSLISISPVFAISGECSGPFRATASWGTLLNSTTTLLLQFFHVSPSSLLFLSLLFPSLTILHLFFFFLLEP